MFKCIRLIFFTKVIHLVVFGKNIAGSFLKKAIQFFFYCSTAMGRMLDLKFFQFLALR